MGIGANTSDVGAGALREIFAYDRRIQLDDGYGNITGDWQEQFRAATGLAPLKGGEVVLAARLEGRQPYIATIRYSTSAALVTTDWRCRDVRTGATYAVTTHVPRARKDYIDMIVTEGIADSQVT